MKLWWDVSESSESGDGLRQRHGLLWGRLVEVWWGEGAGEVIDGLGQVCMGLGCLVGKELVGCNGIVLLDEWVIHA